MIIDIHAHITYARFPEISAGMGKKPFTVKTLLKRMDQEGIDKSVLLPLTNPENLDFFAGAGNQECLEACKKYADRLIPFCNIDPRSMMNTPRADLSQLIRVYKDQGCKGIGEVCANIPITDLRYKNLFYHAGKEKMPLLFHFANKSRSMYGAVDSIHLPGLESVLKEFPKTIFIGHAPSFWNEIDGNLRPKDRNAYPTGPIKKKGRLWKLLAKYPNLYADISARSGFNAISRDPETGYQFLNKFSRKIFFGTDRFSSKDEPVPKILAHLYAAKETKRILKSVYDTIMYRNFNRVIINGKK